MPKKKDRMSPTRRGGDRYNIAPKNQVVVPKNMSIRGSLHRLKKKK